MQKNNFCENKRLHAICVSTIKKWRGSFKLTKRFSEEDVFSQNLCTRNNVESIQAISSQCDKSFLTTTDDLKEWIVDEIEMSDVDESRMKTSEIIIVVGVLRMPPARLYFWKLCKNITSPTPQSCILFMYANGQNNRCTYRDFVIISITDSI